MRALGISAISMILTAIVVGNAYYQKKQFYPSVVYITKSNPSMAVSIKIMINKKNIRVEYIFILNGTLWCGTQWIRSPVLWIVVECGLSWDRLPSNRSIFVCLIQVRHAHVWSKYVYPGAIRTFRWCFQIELRLFLSYASHFVIDHCLTCTKALDIQFNNDIYEFFQTGYLHPVIGVGADAGQTHEKGMFNAVYCVSGCDEHKLWMWFCLSVCL